jgi:glycogen operon protein
VKLIAEPWDVGAGGYQVGNFPVQWTEWNGKYRDTVRRFWKGDGGLASEFATRLAGSSDLFGDDGRKPYASINFVTCHDGFSLQDLVSYIGKHNEANGENNRDGADNNDSWNCGAEGPTDDAAVNDLRERQKRNLVATLLLSQGVPMLLAGDELSHTQRGNNNTYCQDNELTWLNWDLTPVQRQFLEFIRTVTRIMQDQPAFQRRRFFRGQPIRGAGVKDVAWLAPDGNEMSDEAWGAGFVKCLGVQIAGQTGELDEFGKPVVGDTLLLLLNAHHEPIPFTLPAAPGAAAWEPLFDTADPAGAPAAAAGQAYPLRDRSMAVFRARGRAPAGVAPGRAAVGS